MKMNGKAAPAQKGKANVKRDQEVTSVNPRRKFLKQATASAGAAAIAITTGFIPQVRAQKTAPRWGMVIDLRKCFGCHACSIACKSEFNVPLGVWRSWVSYTERGEYPQVQRNFLPLLCNQCDNPPCVDVCPSGATYRREDGIVMQVDEKCIGCKACIQGCPYRVKFVNPETKTAQKCDFCVHRVDQGIVPSCVNTCNARARIFGDLNNPDSEISKVIQENKVQSLRTELGTEPRVFYIGLDQFSYDPVKSKAPGISHEHGDLK